MNNTFHLAIVRCILGRLPSGAILGALLLGALTSWGANSGLSFTRLGDFYVSPSAAYPTALADVNHDGRPDLLRFGLISMGGPYGLKVQLGLGNGTFGPATNFITGFQLPVIQVADFNNDGHPDVLLALNDRTLAVLPGNGNGTFQSPVITAVSVYAEAIAVTDFNKDGKLDVILCGYPSSPLEGYISTMTGNGNGTFGNASTFPSSTRTATTASKGVAAGDFNGDGYPDFVVSNPGSAFAIAVFMNNKNGTFSRMREVGVPGFAGKFAVGDFNNDGKTDFAFTIFSESGWGTGVPGYDIGIALGHGDGTFGSLVENGTLVLTMECPIYSVGSTSDYVLSMNDNVVAADMDGDGDLDLVVPNSSRNVAASFVSILRNNGSGAFGLGRQLSVNYRSTFVSVGDLEGDGAPDLVVTPNDSTTQTLISGAIAPVITSASSTTFVVGENNSFTVTATALPPPTFFIASGYPPGNVSLSSSGVLSGSPASFSEGVYNFTIKATNGAQPEATQNFTLTVTRGVPVVNATNVDQITATSARLWGNVESQGTTSLTRRGVVYARTSVNANPTLGASGTTALDDGLVTIGSFTRNAVSLSPVTQYSFRAFAVNSKGTAYSAVVTFQTISLPGSGSLVVTTTADEDNGNSDPNNGSGTSLREAIHYANALGGAQTITFSPNLFVGGSATLTMTGQVLVANLTGTTTLAGPGARQLTIDGNGNRIFQMNDGGLELNGITFTRGGGTDGGAMRTYGTLVINDCVFTNNTAMSAGGAIYNGGAARISRTTFAGNRAGVTGFSSTGSGGAIANEGVLNAVNCTFYRNVADNGAADASGGALANIYSASSIRLTCSTITSNSASGSGGAIKALTGFLLINNSIVSGNTAPTDANIAGTAAAISSYNLVDANVSDIFATGLLEDNGGATPTVALKPNGLAIDAGTNALAVDPSNVPLGSDQRALARINHGTVDVGAYEFQFAPPVITSAGAATFTAGVSNSFSVIATGHLATVLFASGSLPPGISFSGGVFSGTAPFGVEGDYPITITASNGLLPNTIQDFTLTIAPSPSTPTTLSSWRASVGLAADGSQDFANPSGDGVANVVKYAFNLASTPGDLLTSNRTVMPPNGTAGLPAIRVDATPRLMFQFVRRKASTNPGIGYQVETGTDLSSWSVLDLSSAIVDPIDATWERVTIIDPTSTPTRFGRVTLVGLNAYRNNFNSAFGAASLRGTAVWTNQAVQLTDTIGGQLGAVVFDGVYAGPALNGFTARFNLNLGPAGQAVPADGVSFVVGDLGSSAWGEMGPATARSLTINFDTYNNGGDADIGIHVFTNGVTAAGNPLNPFTGGVTVPVEINYDAAAGVTVKFNGTTIFDQVSTRGFVLPSGSKFGIGGRTGGAVERAVIDDVEIVTR